MLDPSCDPPTAVSGEPRLSGRLRREVRTIGAMLRLYCRDHHGAHSGLCSDCTRLFDYAKQRLSACPFGHAKPACNHCPVHCYTASQRARIRSVMRYAGPRMLVRHPLLGILHLVDTLRPVPDRRALRRRR